MIRIDAFTRLRDSTRNGGPVGQVAHIEISPADHEEPTWEVRQPGDLRRRRLDGRTRAILSGAAVGAIVVNAGAAWMYWRITGSHTGPATSAETVVELALRARSDLNRPLMPGQTGNMTVTVTNDYDFPIRITAVTPGAGNIVADDEHRDAGCKESGVTVARERFPVTWEVPRNMIGAYTIPEALTMRPDANPECAGAVFTVPIQASGVSRRSS
jgi:hypothetical protein